MKIEKINEKKLILKGVSEKATRTDLKNAQKEFENFEKDYNLNLEILKTINQALRALKSLKKYPSVYKLSDEEQIGQDIAFEYAFNWIKELLNPEYIHSENKKEKISIFETIENGQFKVISLENRGANIINKLTPKSAVELVFDTLETYELQLLKFYRASIE